MKLSNLSTLLSISLLAYLAMETRALPVEDLPRGSEREMEKRQSAESQSTTEADETDAGDAYIRKLYDELSQDEDDFGDPIEAQTNTIRSLKNTAEVKTCDMFSFSLEDVYHLEFITNAQLTLHTQKLTNNRVTSNDPSPLPLFVVVKKDSETDKYSFIASLELSVDAPEGWIEFQLQPVIARYVRDGKSSAVFKVEVYENRNVYYSPQGRPLDCDSDRRSVSFVFRGHPNKEPFLALHSYDNRINQIDYTSTLNKLNTDDTPTNNVQRNKRQVIQNDGIPGCRVNPLHIPVEHIPLSSTVGEGEIKLPRSNYSAGICGGLCGNGLPQYTHLKHSQLVHFLVSSPDFEKPTFEGLETKYFQCCAPVQYKSLPVYFKPTHQGAKVLRIPNMRITRCDCLEIMSFEEKKNTKS